MASRATTSPSTRRRHSPGWSISARVPLPKVFTVASCPASSNTIVVLTISSSVRTSPSSSTRTSSDTRSPSGERRFSAMRFFVYAMYSAAAVSARTLRSSLVFSSYIFTIACDQSSNSCVSERGTPNIEQITATEYGCA